MKKYTKIALLVALVLFLTLTACQRQVATSPVTTPTNEVPFPVSGSPVPANQFATQTAAALATPATGGGAAATTPQVSVLTETPTGGQATGGEAGGGQAQPTANPAAGGGQAAATATAPAAAPLPMPTVTPPAAYTLQNGEFPYCIARRYNLDIAALLSINGLNSNSKPGVGASLKIPTSGSWDTASYGKRMLANHPSTYTVAAGDNIYSIACKYGDVAPESILAYNGLKNPTDIRTGMSLKIP